MQHKILLIVDDDEGITEQLKWCFEEYQVITAKNRIEAISLFRRFEPQVVSLDLGLMPHQNTALEGMATLTEILTLKQNTKIIVVTGQNDRKLALDAIAMGAYDFYQKPIDASVLKLMVQRAFYLYQIELENTISLEDLTNANGILTSNALMLKTCAMIDKVAPTNVSVLLLGESGTGKECFAKAIHKQSNKVDGKYIAINCAAIPETLLESELFGVEKGAFSGATKQVVGKIELAHKGTLFLDEIGDLPISLQPKLLRFLQERKIERLGGRQEISLDVRVICATHQPLEELIERHVFREDLYYRISEIAIKIPSLRDRGADSILLAHVFMRQYAKEFNRVIKGFSKEALKAIELYTWPGNVRQLENTLKRAVIMCETKYIEVEDLGFEEVTLKDIPFNLKEIRYNSEKEAILRALEYCEGNLSKASNLLGITRPTLYNLADKLGFKEKLNIEERSKI